MFWNLNIICYVFAIGQLFYKCFLKKAPGKECVNIALLNNENSEMQR